MVYPLSENVCRSVMSTSLRMWHGKSHISILHWSVLPATENGVATDLPTQDPNRVQRNRSCTDSNTIIDARPWLTTIQYGTVIVAKTTKGFIG